jgi:hypothetical protein
LCASQVLPQHWHLWLGGSNAAFLVLFD